MSSREQKWVLNPEIRHQRYFEEMTRIPHGSYHEQKYGDYLEQFAREHGLDYRRDEIGNVIMYKPASKGYESHPTLALQAHMDMVWATDENCTINLETDPLELYIKDGYLRAKGTTLGADNGTGVAYILAVLDDEEQKHPALEAVFTVQEEVGLCGALAMDPSWITARQFISLDCGGGDEIYISSLAGYKGTFSRKVRTEEARGGGYEIQISGLLGGYSSEYREEHANANALAARLLKHLEMAAGIRLSDIRSANDSSKICTDCTARFTSEAAPEEIQSVFEREAGYIKKELGPAEPDVVMELRTAEVTEQLTEDDSRAALSWMYLFPCGFRHRHSRFPEITSECINWQKVEIEDNSLKLRVGFRGSSDSIIEHVHGELTVLAELFQGEEEKGESFPAWEFHDSDLLKTLRRVFRESEGKELGLIPVQGGLECGVFAQRYPDMDIIAMGPYGHDPHTTKERLDLANFDSLYAVFGKLLENL